MMTGRATPEGTAALRDRMHSRHVDAYRCTTDGLVLSSVGFGMYKGAANEDGDALWIAALTRGIELGMNVVDVAMRYRNMRSEPLLGRVLSQHVAAGGIRREEMFIATKGGLIGIPEGMETSARIDEIVLQYGVPRDRIVRNLHCLEVEYLAGELERSRQRLGLATIDCYFLHNPEMHFELRPGDDFYTHLRDVFAMLEQRVTDGVIASYGIASWNGFRRRSSSPIAIDLRRVLDAARAVAGDGNHFRYIEIPLSVGMPFNYHNVVQDSHDHAIRLLDLAATEGINVLASASMYEGNLPQLYTLARLMQAAGDRDSVNHWEPAVASLPVSENSMIQLLELLLAWRQSYRGDLEAEISALSSDALSMFPAALNVTRSIPGIVSALVGMHNPAFVEEDAAVLRQRCVAPDVVDAFFQLLSLRTDRMHARARVSTHAHS